MGGGEADSVLFEEEPDLISLIREKLPHAKRKFTVGSSFVDLAADLANLAIHLAADLGNLAIPRSDEKTINIDMKILKVIPSIAKSVMKGEISLAEASETTKVPVDIIQCWTVQLEEMKQEGHKKVDSKIKDCSSTKFGGMDIRYKSDYAMKVMKKSGWAEGEGLGKKKQGDVDPIKVGRDCRAAVPPPANILKETVFYNEHGVAYDSKTFREFCKAFNKSEVGDLVIGQVKSICEMGVWVNLGTQVSLCHISEACEHYITLAELQERLAVGTRVTARVIKKHCDGKLPAEMQ